MKLTPKIKIWLSTEANEGAFGGGKYRLLKAIEEQGSLAAAAEKLNISYRKAWGDLKKAEQYLGITLIVKTRGGSGGGQTLLTPEGVKLLKAYSEFVTDVKQFVTESYQKQMKFIINRTPE